MTNVNEIWLPVKGYEGIYEISSLGRVKSLARFVVSRSGITSFFHEKMIYGVPTDRHYIRINLTITMVFREFSPAFPPI